MGWFRNLGNDRPWAQGCVIADSGLVLSVGSCFGLLGTLGINGGNSSQEKAIGLVIGVVLGLSVLAVPMSFIWFIVGLVKNANRNPQPPPPTASPAE